jgi:hypothetical protein
MSLLASSLAGCGEVHFVPAPFTPQKVELVYSAQEDVTIVRWRVEATAPLSETRFDMLGPDGYKPVDFSRSVFAGGLAPCDDAAKGTCAQYIVRGHYPQHVPAGPFRPIRAVHELYGELPGAPAKARTMASSFGMHSVFNFENDPVIVTIDDKVASDGPYKFPRPFERAMWPTAGLCVADAPPTGVGFQPLDLTTGIPPEKPLTDSGIYCVAIRPLPADGGATAMVQERIATVPELISARHVLSPPVETSPIFYQVILDLEIPVADRCAEAVKAIERMVNKFMQRGNYVQLPPIDLSPNCMQENDRALAAADVAAAVKEKVMTFPEVHHQYHFMYFNNLDAPLPPQLTQSLEQLFAALAGPPPGYELLTIPMLFSPPTTALSTLPWMFMPWKAYDDPEFELVMGNYALSNLPFRTQIVDAGVPVPLLSPEDSQAYAGHLIKICSSVPSADFVSTDGPYPLTIFAPSWTIDAAHPPAYRLPYWQQQIVVPWNAFVANKVYVDYQICTRYCTDHGYVTAGGVGINSWADNTACASESF